MLELVAALVLVELAPVAEHSKAPRVLEIIVVHSALCAVLLQIELLLTPPLHATASAN